MMRESLLACYGQPHLQVSACKGAGGGGLTSVHVLDGMDGQGLEPCSMQYSRWIQFDEFRGKKRSKSKICSLGFYLLFLKVIFYYFRLFEQKFQIFVLAIFCLATRGKHFKTKNIQTKGNKKSTPKMISFCQKP